MKVTNQDQQGDSGLYHVGQQVTDNLNWIFRPQKERDYGIDALLEIVTIAKIYQLYARDNAAWSGITYNVMQLI